jgi:hypothetical protein
MHLTPGPSPQGEGRSNIENRTSSMRPSLSPVRGVMIVGSDASPGKKEFKIQSAKGKV